MKKLKDIVPSCILKATELYTITGGRHDNQTLRHRQTKEDHGCATAIGRISKCEGGPICVVNMTD